MAFAVVVVHLLAVLFSFRAAQAQERQTAPRTTAPVVSCDEFLPAKSQVGEKRIGPEACRVVSEEIVFNLKGQRYAAALLREAGGGQWSRRGWALSAHRASEPRGADERGDGVI